jgi:hypothetical protein
MVFAGGGLDKARRIFERMVKHRPRIRLTIRQRARVLNEWPRSQAKERWRRRSNERTARTRPAGDQALPEIIDAEYRVARQRAPIGSTGAIS